MLQGQLYFIRTNTVIYPQQIAKDELVTQLKEAALSTGLVRNESKTEHMKINRNMTSI
jgi:hypothetical protein